MPARPGSCTTKSANPRRMALDLEGLQAAGQVTTTARWSGSATCAAALAALDEVNRIILDLRPTLLEALG